MNKFQRYSACLGIFAMLSALTYTSPAAVTNFTLINADTDTAISSLQDAGTIDLLSAPTRNLSIRANVDSTPGSVLFNLDGKTYHAENSVPFALSGHSNGNYFVWTPEPGSHSLTATPYSDTNGTGAAGTGLTISFNVTDEYSHRLGSITVNAAPGVPVTIEQTRHDFVFGCMLNINGFNGDMSASDEAMYRATFLSNFNYSVHGNAMKWYSTEPDSWKIANPTSPPRWSNADLMLDWCESNGIPMRGHTLFWGANHATSNGACWDPDWVEALNDIDLAAEIRKRATNITERFAGRIDEFDLNNEMLNGGNYYKNRLGWGIVSNMAAWAKEGNPNCKLYANDFNVLSSGSASAYASHINTLLANGIDIDGIGCQGHFGSTLYSQANLKAKLDTLSAVGLPIKVTEYDFNTTDENKKRDGLENIYRACFAHTNVNGIVQWGFWEGRHWRPDAALWTSNWTPTLAAVKYRDLVFNEWWTTAAGDVPAGSNYPVRAFLGTYKVTIDGIQQAVVLTPDQSEILLTYDGGSTTTNYPLQVTAGSNITLTYPTVVANVSGFINDQGVSATSLWSQVSGPGTVTFGDPSSTNTSVTLPPVIGSYMLRFYADNAASDDTDYLTITLKPAITNLISNPGFETGTTASWTDHATLTLNVVSSEAQEGTYSCLNSGRNASYDGVAKELKDALSNGVTYVISAWVKMETATSAPVSLTFKKIEDGGAAKYQGFASITATNTEWRRLAGEYSVSTTGTVNTLLLYMSGPGPNTNYWADNFSCYEGTIATLDADMDSIVDEWEWQNFGSIGTSSGAPSDDADGDGFIDLHEYYALTDPNDSNDVFVIDNMNLVTTNASQSVVSWYAASTRLYSILSATNMTGSWTTNLYRRPGQDATTSYTNALSDPKMFYRLKVELSN